MPLIAGATLNLGLYGIIRINVDLLPATQTGMGIVMLLIGTVTALIGILYATIEDDLKMLLAHSSIENAGIIVSLFIDPVEKQILGAAKLGAPANEIHTGAYANVKSVAQGKELKRILKAAQFGKNLGLKIHAGHGLTYENIFPLLAIPEIEEFNIGHSIISRALFVGIAKSVSEMKKTALIFMVRWKSSWPNIWAAGLKHRPVRQ